MQSVGAAWLMTSLSSGPLQIALIQTASPLPFFILALPAGSIGDIVDRRKLILGTEFWMLAMAGILVVATFTHLINPWLLLLLTFALSIGDALELLLEFLADGYCCTALKERKEHKRSFPAYWIVEVLPPKPALTDSRGNRHRHWRYLDHSPPYQGRVACGESSVLVFEWEWCAIDKDLELA
jgi:hypothetical protein